MLSSPSATYSAVLQGNKITSNRVGPLSTESHKTGVVSDDKRPRKFRKISGTEEGKENLPLEQRPAKRTKLVSGAALLAFNADRSLAANDFGLAFLLRS